MDFISIYREKLVTFRIKELKDILGQLGLAKNGRKEDLVNRVLTLLHGVDIYGSARKNFSGKEGVAKVIDDAYRKLQGVGATSSVTDGVSNSSITTLIPKEEHGYLNLDKNIRCPCGCSLPTENMIQCADPECSLLQHICCVIIPEMSFEGIPPLPPKFYCEVCRINRADPFLVTVAQPLSPVKLVASNIPVDGTNPMQNVETEFVLTRTDRKLLENAEYDVQAWCILLNDSVPFRMHWLKYSDLRVNGLPVMTVSRPGSQMLGANGRDVGPMIALYMVDGFNKISLSGCDTRTFCLGVRLVKRRSVQQVLSLIREEQNGELFADALARIRRCIGGGMDRESEDSDSDLEVVEDFVTVNLRCPMSGSRMKIAGRFKSCAHMGCFDLDTFVELNQRSMKWQCPICLKNYSLDDIIIDPYFNRILKMMWDCGEDIIEIDMKPDGSWRAKSGCSFKNLEQWHFADGSLCVSAFQVGSNMQALWPIKQEGTAEQSGGTRFGIKENEREIVEDSRPQGMQSLSSGNQLEKYFENHHQKVITVSSSESSGGFDSRTVNQNCSEHFNLCADNGHDRDSMLYDFNIEYGITKKSSAASLGAADVIFLSDSEEENANLVFPKTVSSTCPLNDGWNSFSASSGIPDAYLEDQHLAAGPRLQVFGTDADVSGILFDTDQTPSLSSAPTKRCMLASNCNVDAGGQLVDSHEWHSNVNLDDSLVRNPLGFLYEGSFPQNSLPTQPAGMSMQSAFQEPPPTLNSVHNEKQNSLGHGNIGRGAGALAESSTSNGLDLGNQFESHEAALLPVMNDEARSNETASVKRSDGPFSFPRKQRSVRRLNSSRFELKTLST